MGMRLSIVGGAVTRPGRLSRLKEDHEGGVDSRRNLKVAEDVMLELGRHPPWKVIMIKGGP